MAHLSWLGAENFMKKFRFSIVMAVYNVALFLDEAVESVLNQDIGFEEYVQLILVDDGSADSTGKLCDAYKIRYPQNIEVIHQANGGVSRARNAGLALTTGEFINFLDGDDKLSKNALRKVNEFFSDQKEVELVSLPLMFFDGRHDSHILNYKYKDGTRLIDLEREPDKIQLHIGSSFIRRGAALGIHFDERLKFAEDAKECVKILARTRKLGVIADACYYYRRRSSGEQSAIQQSERLKAWYLPHLKYFAGESLLYMKEKYGRIPRFVQYTVMYDLQWRLISRQTIDDVLGGSLADEFIDKYYALLAYIEDDIILAQGWIYASYKLFLLSKKYKVSPLFQLLEHDVGIKCAGYEITKLSRCAAKLEFLHIKDDCLHLEGYTGFAERMPLDGMETFLQVNGDEFVPCEQDFDALDRVENAEIFGTVIFPAITFRARVENISRYSRLQMKIFTKYRGIMIERKVLLVGLYFPVVKDFPHAYAQVKDYLAHMQENSLEIMPANFWRKIRWELFFWRDFFRGKKPGRWKAIAYRTAYHLCRIFAPKNIWLVSDRINKADDNGEALFRYLRESGRGKQAFFILGKGATDRQRLRRYGNVLIYRSKRHRLMHLLSEKIISSAGDEYVMNPFGDERIYYWDILRQKPEIFLQHGIIKDDLSEWLGRYKKNLSMFVTSALPEHKSILEGKYFYGEDVVKLTGLPRYDYLVREKAELIVIMPTWREQLTNISTYSVDGIRRYADSFTDTKYFRFYQDLLNDSRLLGEIEKYGYKLFFMPHPNIMPVIDCFNKADGVEFGSINTSYRSILSRAALVVTDYSSVVFDAAYLRVPVLYCQFDREEFFKAHVYRKGYFDYERDGFGEVEEDLPHIVDRIIEYVKMGCQWKEKYRRRVQEFYAFHDKRNSERVYKAILELDN